MRSWVIAAVLWAGCGGGAEPPAEHPRPSDGEGGAAPSEPAAPENARVLGADATFGDLVSAARRLDDRREADSDAACLLRGGGGAPFRLEADLAVAVRPLPDAPNDLDPRVGEARGPVRVLTRWGQLGGTGSDVVLVAMTSTQPLRAREGIALFVTDRGVYLRGIGDEALDAGPLPLAGAMSRVSDRIAEAALPVFVTAESGVPVQSVRELLAAIPTALSGLVSLAVPLAPETRLPDPAAVSHDERLLCPDGLPAPPPDTETGALDAQDILSSLMPLREGARQCFDNATGTAALGGRVSLQIRIGPDGEVTEGCFTADEIGDATFRTCVLEAARATRFPAPDPHGTVAAEIPLSFTPEASLRQTPLCD